MRTIVANQDGSYTPGSGGCIAAFRSDGGVAVDTGVIAAYASHVYPTDKACAQQPSSNSLLVDARSQRTRSSFEKRKARSPLGAGLMQSSICASFLAAHPNRHHYAMSVAVDNAPLNPAVAPIVTVISVGRIAVAIPVGAES